MRKRSTALWAVWLGLFFWLVSPAAVRAGSIDFTIRTGKDYSLSVKDAAGNTVGDIPREEENTVISLTEGTYTYEARGDGYGDDSGQEYGWGRGSFRVDGENKSLSLRRVYMPLENKDSKAFSLKVTDASGTAYEPGGTRGVARQYLTLPVSDTKTMAYTYAFEPAKGAGSTAEYWGSNGEMYIHPGTGIYSWTTLCRSDHSGYRIAEKTRVTLAVPEGVTPRLMRQPWLYSTREYMKDARGQEPQGAPDESTGLVNYTYEVPESEPLQVELYRDGYIKLCQSVSSGTNPMTVTFEERDWEGLAEAGNQTDDRKNSILTNVGDSGSLSLQVGEQFDLYCFRNKQSAVHSPEYRAEILEGDAVTVADDGSAMDRAYRGGPTIEAVRPGTGILRISYGAFAVKDNKGITVYGKSGRDSEALVVVQVGNGGGDSRTGISDSEFDAVYYLESLSDGNSTVAGNGYAEYMFSPPADGKKADHVSVLSPSGGTYTDWKEYGMGADGSCTVRLYQGKNIIRVQSGGSEAYHVLQCYGLKGRVEGGAVYETDDGPRVRVPAGGEVKLNFDGLVMTLPAIEGIYNPGIRNTGVGWQLEPAEYLYYLLDGERIEGRKTQYDLPEKHTITWTAPSREGEYIFAGGRVSTTGFGSQPGSHQKIEKGSRAGVPHLGMIAPAFSLEYSFLPDIGFTVAEEADEGEVRPVTVNWAAKDQPSGAALSVYNARGGKQYTSGGKWMLTPGAYTYAITCEGYLTAHGVFEVPPSDEGNTENGGDSGQDGGLTVDLPDVTLEKALAQGGTARVEISGHRGLLARGLSAIDTKDLPDLAKKRYTAFNYGGYTILHALIDTLNRAEQTFTCRCGILRPEDGADGVWYCEVNGKPVEDYANTLAEDGDTIELYTVLPGQAVRGRFVPLRRALARENSAAVVLEAKPICSGSAYGPFEGAELWVDGRDSGVRTDTEGRALLPGGVLGEPGLHTVTAVREKDGGNTFVYTAMSIYLRREKALESAGRTAEESAALVASLFGELDQMGDAAKLVWGDMERISGAIARAEALDDGEYTMLLEKENGAYVEKLELLYTRRDELMSENAVDGVKALITALHDQKVITEESEAAIVRARAAYDALTDQEKARMITYENWLIGAETMLYQIRNVKMSLSSDSFEYDGTAKEPAVTVTLDGKEMEAGAEYSVAYRDNVEPGTASAVVTLAEKAGFTASRTLSFTILPAKNTPSGTEEKPRPGNGQEDPQPAVLKKGAVYVVGNLKYKITRVNGKGTGGEAAVTGVKNKKLAQAAIPA
ncbi:MAG TPA: hypothetical protein DF613_06970, partial [Lachnospiraceae bacterium]|nr:hypothetical protein [Lachnospiraceae bacterium]